MAAAKAGLKRHESVSELTAIRLLQTLEHIEVNPEGFHSEFWGSDKRFDMENRRMRPGMSACFAAHVVMLFADDLTPEQISGTEVGKEAARLLRDKRTKVLFMVSSLWPNNFFLYNAEGDKVKLTPAGMRWAVERFVERGTIY